MEAITSCMIPYYLQRYGRASLRDYVLTEPVSIFRVKLLSIYHMLLTLYRTGQYLLLKLWLICKPQI